MRHRLGLALLATLATLAAAAPADAERSASQTIVPPKEYYLALGDSITYGFQSSKFFPGVDPVAFSTGYVDVFAARLRAIRPQLRVVNYGCPGETTILFRAGPCLTKALGVRLHDDYQGSQLDAAIAFLRAHRGRVSPITFHLFGNDVNDFIASCGGDFDCIRTRAPAAIAEFGSRLSFILAELRAAAPDAEIVVVGGWNARPQFLADIDPLIQAVNAAIAATAAQHRAAFADVVPVFNPTGEAARLAAICSLTLLCAEGDAHPSDAGYRAIADVVFAASGYRRFIHGERTDDD